VAGAGLPDGGQDGVPPARGAEVDGLGGAGQDRPRLHRHRQKPGWLVRITRLTRRQLTLSGVTMDPRRQIAAYGGAPGGQRR
jgi:hypothetical protein